MLVLTPSYYEKFQCIGNACLNNCCRHWVIFVDDATYEFYKQVPGEFGEKLRNNIVKDDNGKMRIKLEEKEKTCPFLNENNLCEVYIELGPEKMGHICQNYPRRSQQLGDILEIALHLSCSEVIKILFSETEPISFTLSETDNSDSAKEENSDIDFDLYNYFLDTRTLSIEILQNRTLPLWKRFLLLVMLTEKIQLFIDDIPTGKKTVEVFKNENNIQSLSQRLSGIPNIKQKKIDFVIWYFAIIKKAFFKEDVVSPMQFYEPLIETYLPINDLEKAVSLYESAEQEFFKTHPEHVCYYENYMVANLFHHYMGSLTNKNIYENVVIAVLSYSLLKTITILKWLDNGKQISLEEEAIIFSSYFRSMDHNMETRRTIYKFLEKTGVHTFDYIALLLAGDFA